MIEYHFLDTPSLEQIAQITDLYREAGWWPEPMDDPELVRKIVEGSHCFLIARSDNRIIAMGRAISDRACDAYIQDISVLSDWRHRNIGSEIIRRLSERLFSDGIDWIGLIAERNSQEFYLGLGFKPMPDSTPMLLRKT